MQTVAIAGVGLIGGSFALAIRKAGFSGRILGVSSPATIAQALDLGVIDEGTTLEDACGRADLVYLAGPIRNIIELLPKVAVLLKPGALVTDAGSTKSRIVEAGKAIKSPSFFLGGHPMAGKESRGVAAADADLFQGRPYVLTPGNEYNSNTPVLESFLDLVRSIGALPSFLSAAEHDRIVAFTSHLPQLLSTALAVTLPSAEKHNVVAGPSVIELTRLALSPYEMWRDIFETNSQNISDALEILIDKLKYLQGNLTGDLESTFDEAHNVAAALRKKSK